MANIGTFTDQGKSMLVVGVAGVSDNDVVMEVDAADRFNEFSFSSSTGVMEVDVSLDGANFQAIIALEDKHSVAPATRVIITVADLLYYVEGCFKTIRVRQASGTAVTAARMICGKIGR